MLIPNYSGMSTRGRSFAFHYTLELQNRVYENMPWYNLCTFCFVLVHLPVHTTLIRIVLDHMSHTLNTFCFVSVHLPENKQLSRIETPLYTWCNLCTFCFVLVNLPVHTPLIRSYPQCKPRHTVNTSGSMNLLLTYNSHYRTRTNTILNRLHMFLLLLRLTLKCTYNLNTMNTPGFVLLCTPLFRSWSQCKPRHTVNKVQNQLLNNIQRRVYMGRCISLNPMP